MEESQADHSGDRHVAGAAAVEPGFGLDLRRVSYRELAAQQSGLAERLLGAVAYGAQPPARAPMPVPWIAMPVLAGEAFCELWLSDEPVVRADAHGVSGAYNEHSLFGCLQMPEEDTLEGTAESAYRRLFDFADELAFPHLLRIWNYFPGINKAADGTERYRRFNVGRREAFAAKGRVIGQKTPAACALGCRGGPLTVFFIAGRAAGRPIENPRQVSAYRYPPRYGPTSPAFSRAMLAESPHERALFISGTASIVGHETLHAGDVAAQIEETIANLRAVLEAAGPGVRNAKLWLKAYIRHPEHAPQVQTALARAFSGADIVYLQADICRSDLLVEVEAVCFEHRLS